MRIHRLIFRELWHRKGTFLLGALSMAVAIGCLSAALAFLQEHRLRTDALIAAKEADTKTRLAALEDDVRKLTVRMGFNILILPKEQNLNDLYAADYAEKCMPEEFVTRLVQAGVATLNHILPSLQQKVKWTEKDRTVLVMGVCGEVLIQGPGQKPIQEGIYRGEAVLGHELHRSLGLKKGDAIRFLGRNLTVAECRPEKGSKDDITIWLNLAEAQELLGKPGKINAILALECNCDSVDRLGEVRAEVARILPETQVIEYSTQALARAEARNRTALEARMALEQEKKVRAKLSQEKEEVAALVVPLVLLACLAWVGFLAWANVRERRPEIGLLRALGVGSGPILGLFLGRAALMGCLGGACGYAGGLLLAVNWSAGPEIRIAAVGMMTPSHLVLVLLAAPLLAAAATWLPAFWATQQDPATILQGS